MRRWLAIALAACWPVAASALTYKVSMLVPADDPRLERARVERAAPGHATGPLADALKVALAEGQFELEGAGVQLALSVQAVADAAGARAAATAAEKAGAAVLVADLPAAWLLAGADAVKLPVLNVSATADSLRQAQCRPNLFHLAPSERMKADALAQALVARRWHKVLLLTSSRPDDAPRNATVQASLQRYGLKVVNSRSFTLSADPRDRDLANPLLLTAATQGDYDVVWVVDGDGEFAVSLPYRTGLPRPVVGDGGLAALAWSPKFERFGAPQVTRRLQKAAGRPLGAQDWPAWLAGKVLVAAAAATPKGPVAAFHKALAEGEVDGSKGVALSFRAWDGQLRQPLMLATADAVIDLAPADAVLHPKNKLDTLGADGPEKLCKR